jgi:hypothetical protein
MGLRLFSSILLLLVLVAPAVRAQDELPPQGKKGKVCVAVVANSTTNSMFVEHMTDRLTENLKQNETEAVKMESPSPMNGKLEPSAQNSQESKEKDCLYILLTRVVDPGQHPLEIQGPRISLGQRPNTVDTADPSNSPLNPDSLRIDFALFRNGRFKPVTDAAVLGHRSNSAADAYEVEMGHEANRITHDINKK